MSREKTSKYDIEEMFKHETAMPEPEPMKRDEILEQYQRAFTVINRRLFNDELPPIMIDYPQEHPEEWPEDFKCSACFYTGDKEPVIFLQFEDVPEQGINTDDIDILCHELIHYFCYLHKIDQMDRDKGQQYHNLNFKKTAEGHGAKCSYRDDENGYCMTEWPPEVLEKIFDEL